MDQKCLSKWKHPGIISFLELADLEQPRQAGQEQLAPSMKELFLFNLTGEKAWTPQSTSLTGAEKTCSLRSGLWPWASYLRQASVSPWMCWR